MSQFDFRVYNRRHNNEITYTLTHTATGWHVQHIAINGESKPDGTPIVYANFEQDFINYPSSFGSFLEHIWSSLKSGEISNSDAQEKVQELANWVSACERSQPEWKGWND